MRNYSQQKTIQEDADSLHKQMGGSLCNQIAPPQTRLIPRMCDDMQKELCILEESVNTLISKLSPALQRVPCDVKEKVVAQAHTSCELGDNLEAKIIHIVSIRTVITDINNRVEI